MAETNYRDLLASIHSDLQGDEKERGTIEVEDENLNVSSVTQSIEKDVEYEHRNELYTQLLAEYIEAYSWKDKSKRRYKRAFFSITMVILCLVVGGCMFSIGYVVIRGDGNYTEIGTVIGSIIGIVTALISIPKIIAEHLFPVNEENNMIDMVKNMQDNDSNIRNVLYGIEKE